MRSCDDIQEALADHGVHALRGAPELAKHLTQCEDCLAVLDGLGELDDWLAEDFTAPAELVAAALARVSSDAVVEQPSPLVTNAPTEMMADEPPTRRVPLSVMIGGFGLAASALLVGGLGLLVSLTIGRSEPQSTDLGDSADQDRFASVIAEEPEEGGEWATATETAPEVPSNSPSPEPAPEVPSNSPSPEPAFDRVARPAPATSEAGGFAEDSRTRDAISRSASSRRGPAGATSAVGSTSAVGNAPPSAPPPVAAATVQGRGGLEGRAFDGDDDGVADEFNGLRNGFGRYQQDSNVERQSQETLAMFEPDTEPELEEEPDEPALGYFADNTNHTGNGRRSRQSSSGIEVPTEDIDYRGDLRERERSLNRGLIDSAAYGEDAFHARVAPSAAAPAVPAAPSPMTSDFLAERERVEGLVFQDARGYWRNTYVPGDPTLRQLEERLGGGAREIADGATPIGQPFDAPEDASLAVYMSTDRRTAAGETRTLVQVGIQGTPRRAGRRPSMNIALVLDLTTTPGAEEARAIRELIEEFGNASDIGDRFSLIVAGRAGGVVIPADQMRYGPATVAAQWLTGVSDAPDELVDGRSLDILSAYEEAVQVVSNADDPSAPLGSSLVWLVTPRSFGSANTGLAQRAHLAAVDGVPTSVLGVGANVATGELENIALAGQGARRQLDSAGEASQTVSEEISAASSVVARAVRLRIRLAPGTRLVDVIGSERLDTLQAERVRQAERSIDQRLSRSMGIQADRGEDEDGIQVVIPAFYAGDSHVILLDVVANGPGPVADVTMRFKDLVNLRNGTARSAASLARGEAPRGPLERNVLKNLLAWELAQALRNAGSLARHGDPNGAAQTLEDFGQRLRATRSVLPGMAGDVDVDADLTAIAAYLHALRDSSLRSRPNELADALLFSSYRELQLPTDQ